MIIFDPSLAIQNPNLNEWGLKTLLSPFRVWSVRLIVLLIENSHYIIVSVALFTMQCTESCCTNTQLLCYMYLWDIARSILTRRLDFSRSKNLHCIPPLSVVAAISLTCKQ